ncbi:hypothetical protein HYW39_02280 [Candidatus Curtissbacteria bacterium]|nr:hypothetical protein [Candidatus Curtissbacteria bacterium]
MNLGLIRAILGIIFAIAGFFLAKNFIPAAFLKPANFIESLVAVVSASFGYFTVPFITLWLRKVSTDFTKKIASEVISQLRLPRVRAPKFTRKQREFSNPMLLDTSAIIDGRIVDVVKLGFLYGTLIVPRFILAELQRIADSSEDLKRAKGRRGFEILEDLKKVKLIKTEMIEGSFDKTIDDSLLKLAKNLKAKIITTDFNLNKVATLAGIGVLNINELVNAIKTTVLPGELLDVQIIHSGKENNQGVGYLSDGTMIVVENGNKMVGKKTQTEVTRVLQTAAGRMIFAQATKTVKR